MNQETIKKIEELAVKEEVRALLYKYTDFVDAKDYSEEAVKEIFTEDGMIRFSTGNTGEGFEGITKAHAEIMRIFVSTNHNVTNEMIELDGEFRAQAKCHAQIYHKFTPEMTEKVGRDLFIVNDRIQAEAVKTEYGWRIKKMELETVYTTMDKDVDEL